MILSSLLRNHIEKDKVLLHTHYHCMVKIVPTYNSIDFFSPQGNASYVQRTPDYDIVKTFVRRHYFCLHHRWFLTLSSFPQEQARTDSETFDIFIKNFMGDVPWTDKELLLLEIKCSVMDKKTKMGFLEKLTHHEEII